MTDLITVKVHKHNDDVAWGFANSAVDAIENYLNPVVNFEIEAEIYGECDVPGTTWGEVHNHFEDYLTDEFIKYKDNICHLLVVDRALPNSAGWSWVKVNGGTWNNQAGQCVANALCKFYINLVPGCFGDGGEGFENTVIHEVGHSLGAEHLHGAIGFTNHNVTPMQTWYTERDCDGNEPLNSNCWNNPQAYANGYQQTITTCAKGRMETYVDNNYSR